MRQMAGSSKGVFFLSKAVFFEGKTIKKICINVRFCRSFLAMPLAGLEPARLFTA